MLKVNDVAPEFTLTDHLGKTVRSKDFAGKRLVLYFYPKADTPGCTKQGCGFRDRSSDYSKKDVAVFGVSFDTVAELKAFADKFKFPFRLLSDPTKQTSIAYQAAESAADKYPKRITYVIGANGKIEHAIDTKDPAGQAEALLKLF